MRVPAAAALPVRSGGQAEVALAPAKHGNVGVAQREAPRVAARREQVEALHAGRSQKPRDLHRARRARQLQRRIDQRGGPQRGQVAAVERRARHEWQPAAGVEIADLRDPAARLEQVPDAAEQAGDGQLHLARRGRAPRAGGEHRAKEQLGGEPLVARR